MYQALAGGDAHQLHRTQATHTSSGGEAPVTCQTTDGAGALDGPGAGPDAPDPG